VHMGSRDRANEIAEIKQREDSGHGYLSFALKGLQEQWLKTKTSAGFNPDFYVIRAVTLLEVSTRHNIAALIDHGEQYVNRAVELSKHLKIDLALVRAVHGRMITIGDIVAHNVPLNSFGQIIGYFDTLFGRPIRPLLEAAIDRWAVEIGQKIAAEVRPLLEGANVQWADDIDKMAAGTIIDDFDSVAACLSRLFEIRHILCHELPTKPIYELREIGEFLDSAFRFAKATEEVLTFEKFGLVPFTQADMNIDAGCASQSRRAWIEQSTF
jgi:hypothetical protein